MRKLTIIGIGTGNPEHMTVQGIKALNSADVILIPRKDSKEGLADLRHAICERFMENAAARIVTFDLPVRNAGDPSYRKGVDDWHAAIADLYATLFVEHTEDSGHVAFLVWGDPSLYDSTLRIIERLHTKAGLQFTLDVVPGITSIQALAASHKMPLNSIGGAVHITTGRRLRAEGFPENADTALVMLDGDCAFRDLPGEAYDIFWGAYLGTPDEIVVSGRLSDVAQQVHRARKEARDAKGWIMDTYLLRRRAG